MWYFNIADITLTVDWESKEERNQIYDLLNVRFHPAFLGAYELSEQEVAGIETFDLAVMVRKTTKAVLPQHCIVIKQQHYYKEDNLFCITTVSAEGTPVFW